MRDRPSSAHLTERVLYLKSIPVFDAMPPGDLNLLAESVRERFFPKGSVLIEENSPATRMYIIEDGQVQVSRGGRLHGVFGTHESVGGLAVLAADPCQPRAEALADTRAMELKADQMWEAFEDHFSMYTKLLRRVSATLLDLRRGMRQSAGFSDDISDSSCQSCPKRPLDLVERLFFLRRMTLFKEASLDALMELARGMVEVRFKPDEKIWSEGDNGGFALSLVSGVVSCTTNTGQKFRFGPGDVIGGLDANAGVDRWYDAFAVTPVVTLRFPPEILMDVLEDHFDLAKEFLGIFARGIMNTRDRLAREAEQKAAAA